MTRRHWSAVSGLGLLLVAAVPAAAQLAESLESIPGFERYEAVQAALEETRAGGRIAGVTWSEDGTTLEFRRGRAP